MFDCVIVGAGASGMLASIFLARKNKKVLVIEHRGEPGKKITITGNGKCNYFNENMSHLEYPEDCQDFVKTLLTLCGKEEILSFFETIGIFKKERNGYLYPYSENATSFRNAIWDEMKRLSVYTSFNTEISSIQKDGESYVICTDKEEKIKTKTLLLATGGKTFSKTGSDGSGYILAKSLGLKLTKIYPALVKLLVNKGEVGVAKGVRHLCNVSLLIDDKKVRETYGEVQFNEDSISGIPIFEISRYVKCELEKKRGVKVVLDFVREKEIATLKKILEDLKEKMPQRSLTSFFSCFLQNRITECIARKNSIGLNRKMAEIDAEKFSAFIFDMKNYEIKIEDVGSFESAQVCRGGILLDTIDESTMAIKGEPSLFVAGELVDVDAKCGGYNLGFAFISAKVAADGVIKYVG